MILLNIGRFDFWRCTDFVRSVIWSVFVVIKAIAQHKRPRFIEDDL